jgi:hypothetical protein
MWRPLFLDEVLSEINNVTSEAPQTMLREPGLIHPLEQALDDPLAVHPAPLGLERVTDNAAQLATRLSALDIPHQAVCKILARTLARSHVQCDPEALQGAIARHTTQEHPEELADELRPHLRQSDVLQAYVESQINWASLIADEDRVPDCRWLDDRPYDPDDANDRATRGAIPALYLAHPITHVHTLPDETEHVELDSIRYRVRLALAVVLNAQPAALPMRLVHPGERRTERRDSAALARLINDGLGIAHAYIYVGANSVPLGVGGAYELKSFRASTGPIAVAQPGDCPHSPMEELLLDDPMRVTTATLKEDSSDLAAFVAEWFAENFEVFLACQRRRRNRVLMLSTRRELVQGRLKRKLTNNGKIADETTVKRALAASGISVGQLERFIKHPEAMTDIGCEQLTFFLDRLQGPEDIGRGWRTAA